MVPPVLPFLLLSTTSKQYLCSHPQHTSMGVAVGRGFAKRCPTQPQYPLRNTSRIPAFLPQYKNCVMEGFQGFFVGGFQYFFLTQKRGSALLDCQAATAVSRRSSRELADALFFS